MFLDNLLYKQGVPSTDMNLSHTVLYFRDSKAVVWSIGPAQKAEIILTISKTLTPTWVLSSLWDNLRSGMH